MSIIAGRFRESRLDKTMSDSIRKGDFATALDAGERLAWYRPDDPSLIMRRADLAARLNQLPKVAEILGEMPDDAVDSARAALQRGFVFRELFLLDQAVESLQKAIRLNPQLLDAHRLLAGISGVERRAETQKQALWTWFDSGPAPIEALRLIAQSVVVIPPGTLAKTVDEGFVLEKSLEANPDSFYIRPVLARFYRNRGEIDKATALLKNWLVEHPNDASANLEWLACLVEAGDTDLSERFISQNMSQLQDSPEFWILKAKHNQTLKRWDAALADFNQSLKLDAGPPETWFHVAECYRILGQPEQSQRVMKTCEAIRNLAKIAGQVDPLDPDQDLMLEAARRCDQLGRNRERSAWAGEVLKLSPNHAEARALYQPESTAK